MRSPTASRLVEAVSVRNFLDDALLSPEQLRAVGRVRRFEEETRRDVMATGTEAAFGWRAPDPRLVRAFTPLAEEVQGVFDCWRRLLARQGHTSIDFDPARAATLRRGFVEPPVGELVARVAAAMFVTEDAMDLYRRAERVGIDGREPGGAPWVPAASPAGPGWR